MDSYIVLEKIGQGSFGETYKCQDKKTNQLAAIKIVKPDDDECVEQLWQECQNEIEMLNSLQHRNIVQLKTSFMETETNYSSVCLVFELMDFDLEEILSSGKIIMMESEIASAMKQILEALHFCHYNGVLHLDVKPANILASQSGVYKLADFGIACFYKGKRARLPTPSYAVTLWYRPPELLEGITVFGPEVDIWSMGCVMAQMIQGRPLFPGNCVIDQKKLILDMLCANFDPTSASNSVETPSEIDTTPGGTMTNLKATFCHLSPPALHLLTELLELDHSRRISAEGALSCKWLRDLNPAEIPLPNLRNVKKEMRPNSPPDQIFVPTPSRPNLR